MSTPAPTDESRQRAALALLAYLRSPENPEKYRILEPSDLPYLERLSIAAQIPLTLHLTNFTSLTTEDRPVGYVQDPPSSPS
jgi:hypothetical protein